MTWHTTGVGEVKHGLYHLLKSEVSLTALTETLSLLSKRPFEIAATTQNEGFDLWPYSLLGHPSLTNLHFLYGVDNSKPLHNQPCLIFPLAKQHRLSFLVSKQIEPHIALTLYIVMFGGLAMKYLMMVSISFLF